MKKVYEVPELEVLLLDVSAVQMDLYCAKNSPDVGKHEFHPDSGTWKVLPDDYFIPNP